MTAASVLDKRCTRCQQVKPTAEFNRRTASSDGLQIYCRDCGKEASKRNRIERGPTARPTGGTKTCPACKLTQPYEAFYANRARTDGLATYCRACHRIRIAGSLPVVLRSAVRLAQERWGTAIGDWMPPVIRMLNEIVLDEEDA